ncbi:hypothetical protein CVO_00660 [Sulfurimonas sp. CVO]|jgi:lipopolysaccharide export LptBFGC system permease protein LptF|uniref:Uncharacterized protein n=1 Tax=Sulfurimonas xiamenensis TaxID=2590021 RepID=A0AAJ4A518_9BACT|nr:MULTISPECIES: hypothetical protein [Sulfurimonas]QFR44025.1 hypothetical protein FJR47_08875 [Sulfurimonas xiamenensis]QHG90432.1 hypothetical protein CVO_00660 [Sulfurimonas sp. CVO]
MKYILILFMILSVSLIAEEKIDTQSEQKMDKALEEALEQEKKFAKEQKFYQGDEYDLDSHKVDSSSLENITVPEPIDFDMDKAYQ